MNKLSPQWKGFVYGVLTMAVAVVITVVSMRFAGVSDDVVLPIGTEAPGVESWQTVTIGGIVSFEIPSTCTLDPGAGNAYLICPTAENPQPTPEMNFSSDGITVNVHRWEGLETPYWDHIVASMKVVQPMTHDITINVEK